MSTTGLTSVSLDTAFQRVWLAPVVRRVNNLLRAALTESAPGVPEQLRDAMGYACLRGGKRLRPALVCAAGQAVAGGSVPPESPALWRTATAVELIHCFSLVHDDLPGMDNDDLRRGRPTVHKAYDEATAILVGDALCVAAFEQLAAPDVPPVIGVRLVRRLAREIGWQGVIAGQALDMQYQGRAANRDMVDRIHSGKTAALLRASCACGALAVGAVDAVADQLGEVGYHFGMAFQAIDDLLDEVGDPQFVGKRVGKDRAGGKVTLPAAVGLEQTRQAAESYTHAAFERLGTFGPAAEALRQLGAVMLSRRE